MRHRRVPSRVTEACLLCTLLLGAGGCNGGDDGSAGRPAAPDGAAALDLGPEVHDSATDSEPRPDATEATDGGLGGDDATLDAGPPPDAEAPPDADAPSDALASDLHPEPDLPQVPPDSDGDGLTDVRERELGTDPELADTDGDGLDDGEEVARRTDPLRADTDEDGQPDGEEVRAGVDPLDPSSATVWQGEALGGHPRLFFGAADLPELRRRAELQQGPHARLIAGLRAAAGAPVPDNPGPVFDTEAGQAQGRVAEAAAFVGLLDGDPQLLSKAAGVLALPTPAPDIVGGDLVWDIREAQALSGLCTAWDLLAAADDLAPDALAAARAGLLARLAVFRETITGPAYRLFAMASPNNHPAKAAAALGLCALAINDHPQAAWDINEGITGLQYVLADVQLTDDGGHGEGWNYLIYGANSYLPFYAAYQRFAQGRTLPYRVIGTFSGPRHPQLDEIIAVPDPVEHPRVRATFALALRSTLPDGRLPNTDDANESSLHGGLLAVLFDDPRFLHNWALPAVGHNAGYVEVATFALLDPELQPEPPDWAPDAVYPEAGFALLRSDLGPDALWLLAQGEHGSARVNGLGHEHPDATGLMLWYRGEPLLIEAGYINWGHRELVNAASDHSLVLVDGEGPPAGIPLQPIGVDAYLEQWLVGPQLSHLRVRTAYAGAGIQRWVLRLGQRFFAVADVLDPEDGGEHAYTWQLNGLGGAEVPDGTFELLADGGRWSRPAASLRALVTPLQGAAQPGWRAEEHAVQWGAWSTHALMTVDSTMTGPAGFLSLLLPAAAGAEALEPTRLDAGPGVAALCVRTPGEPGVHVLGLHRGADAVTVDMEPCLGDGTPRSVTLPGGGPVALHVDGDEAWGVAPGGGEVLLDGEPLPAP